MSLCTSPVCDRPVYARGWCPTHYLRLLRRGDARPNDPIDSKRASRGARRLSAQPLIEAVERRGGLPAVLSDYASREGVRLRRAYYRAVDRGYVIEPVADDLAVNLLGVHPMDLWGVAA